MPIGKLHGAIQSDTGATIISRNELPAKPMKLTIVIALLLIVAGCGQSGPLFVPGDPSTMQNSQAESQEQTEDDKDEKTDER